MRRLTMMALLAALLAPSLAWAAPPPPDSEDGAQMAPYGDWFNAQTQPDNGNGCCSASDGRPVDADISGDHWRAHVTPAHWPGVRDQWIDIPDEKIIRRPNPTGRAVLWLDVPHRYSVGMPNCEYCGGQDMGVDQTKTPTVFCFAPPLGT